MLSGTMCVSGAEATGPLRFGVNVSPYWSIDCSTVSAPPTTQ
jgi:hypothetical protein